jgi:hypothetical protein
MPSAKSSLQSRNSALLQNRVARADYNPRNAVLHYVNSVNISRAASADDAGF